jgi:hypothetical protein
MADDAPNTMTVPAVSDNRNLSRLIFFMKFFAGFINRNIIKTIIFCIALSICVLFGILSPQWKNEKQNFDMKSAVVISIGLGAVVDMMTLNKKHLF